MESFLSKLSKNKFILFFTAFSNILTSLMLYYIFTKFYYIINRNYKICCM